MIKEFYAENHTSAPLAIARGAGRVKLCDNLAAGDTAPNADVIEETLSYVGEKDILVMATIRPKGGDFVYNSIELKIIHIDLIEVKKLETNGVVFGCLTPSGWLDEEALELLTEVTEGLQITLHMTSSSISEDRQFEAIDWPIEHGIDRILTRGGLADKTIVKNFLQLEELTAYISGRLVILPGGGVTAENAARVAKELSIGEVYGAKTVDLQL